VTNLLLTFSKWQSLETPLADFGGLSYRNMPCTLQCLLCCHFLQSHIFLIWFPHHIQTQFFKFMKLQLWSRVLPRRQVFAIIFFRYTLKYWYFNGILLHAAKTVLCLYCVLCLQYVVSALWHWKFPAIELSVFTKAA
jgi:hypothetical protein